MKTIKRYISRNSPEVEIKIRETGQVEADMETLKDIHELIVKNNRRLARSGGRRLGYSVELISSRSS